MNSQNSSCKICGNWPSKRRVRSSGHTRCIAFRMQMSDLNQLRIPRCVKLNAHQSWKCTDFATPASARSEPTYTFASSWVSTTSFRITVLKVSRCAAQDISLSRLELSVALLLARLINKVRKSRKVWNSRNTRLIYGRT